ncbi:AEC family transporter [Spirulina sp. CCNP1310]|uniref:AEC family transporter n=1 Tax=Spirulina sp. CCNP1310 TaxID=3110249 RepID=UPI002B211733|nr:AEC family transporter [Spirulina sp. CCNP1310]MEA5417853.1 AEC family transporter [Spirulina sp. CCNP1310]
MEFTLALGTLYGQLLGVVGLGYILGRCLSPTLPQRIGDFLFWIGVPLGVLIFLRGADLSGAIALAPLIAWVATLLGAALTWLWSRYQPLPQSQSTGTLMLATMFGNTGYLGYPIILTLLGEQYFAWVLFYDLLGTTVGAYGLGSLIVARFQPQTVRVLPHIELLKALQNPIWWALGLGLWLRHLPLPLSVETSLRAVGWGVISLSLVLIGMRLSQLRSLRHRRAVAAALGIKMVIVPLVLGIILGLLGMTGALRLTLVLQIAMPPAFATLVLSEAYDLDRELAVTAIALGSIALLLTLPIWLLLFPPIP